MILNLLILDGHWVRFHYKRFKVAIDPYSLVEIVDWSLMCVVCWDDGREILRLKVVIGPYPLMGILE